MTSPPEQTKDTRLSTRGKNKFTGGVNWGAGNSFDTEGQVRYIYFRDEGDGGIEAFPMAITGPQVIAANTQKRILAAVVGTPGATDATSGGSPALFVGTYPLGWNGVNYDRLRNNVNLLNVSDASTTTFTGADIATFNARSLLVVIDCTSLTGTSYLPEVDWKDGAGNYPVLWQQKTAKTGAARTLILIGPGVANAPIIASATVGDGATPSVDSATANELIQIPFPVPNTIRIKITKTAVTVFTANLQVQGS